MRCPIAASLAFLLLTSFSQTTRSSGSSQEGALEAEQRLNQLAHRYFDADNAYQDAKRKATDDATRAAAEKLRPDYAAMATTFAEIARTSGENGTAVSAWLLVIHVASQIPNAALVDEAVGGVLQAPNTAPVLDDLLRKLYEAYAYENAISPEVYMGYVRRVAEKAQSGPTHAEALFVLATELIQVASVGSSQEGEAKECISKLQASYADVKAMDGKTYTEKLEPWLFELGHVLVGHLAPEIEAEDLSGVAFKLSDYRGKVVLLDFWGNW